LLSCAGLAYLGGVSAGDDLLFPFARCSRSSGKSSWYIEEDPSTPFTGDGPYCWIIRYSTTCYHNNDYCCRRPFYKFALNAKPRCKGTNVTLSLNGKPLRHAKVDQPPSADANQAVLRVSFLEQIVLGGSKPQPNSRICVTSLSGTPSCNSLDEVLLNGADSWEAALWDDTHTCCAVHNPPSKKTCDTCWRWGLQRVVGGNVVPSDALYFNSANCAAAKRSILGLFDKARDAGALARGFDAAGTTCSALEVKSCGSFVSEEAALTFMSDTNFLSGEPSFDLAGSLAYGFPNWSNCTDEWKGYQRYVNNDTTTPGATCGPIMFDQTCAAPPIFPPPGFPYCNCQRRSWASPYKLEDSVKYEGGRPCFYLAANPAVDKTKTCGVTTGISKIEFMLDWTQRLNLGWVYSQLAGQAPVKHAQSWSKPDDNTLKVPVNWTAKSAAELLAKKPRICFDLDEGANIFDIMMAPGVGIPYAVFDTTKTCCAVNAVRDLQ